VETSSNPRKKPEFSGGPRGEGAAKQKHAVQEKTKVTVEEGDAA